MSRYTKKVLISYDADEAGQKAAQKAIALLGDVGLSVGVIKVPGAKDPDEYIKTYGKDKFRDIISNSKSKFEYNMDVILAKYDINLPQDKIDALVKLENLISTVYSKAERDIYIQNVSDKFNVDPKSIKEDVERIVRKRAFTEKKAESEKIIQESAGYGDRTNPDFAKAPGVAKNEENVLGLMLLYPDYRKLVYETKILTEEDFYTELGRRVFKFIIERYSQGDANVDDLNEVFTPEEIGRLTKMKIKRMELTENGITVFRECVDSLKKSISKKNSEKVSSFDDLNNLINSKK